MPRQLVPRQAIASGRWRRLQTLRPAWQLRGWQLAAICGGSGAQWRSLPNGAGEADGLPVASAGGHFSVGPVACQRQGRCAPTAVEVVADDGDEIAVEDALANEVV
ncbi:MAG: hypothetical protein FAZ92_00529 [Accumulibacter sp.]|nr:MAG: hypothetical protein FAZ92_00529 [Accumulibacter sp.]